METQKHREALTGILKEEPEPPLTAFITKPGVQASNEHREAGGNTPIASKLANASRLQYLEAGMCCSTAAASACNLRFSLNRFRAEQVSAYRASSTGHSKHLSLYVWYSLRKLACMPGCGSPSRSTMGSPAAFLELCRMHVIVPRPWVGVSARYKQECDQFLSSPWQLYDSMPGMCRKIPVGVLTSPQMHKRFSRGCFRHQIAVESVEGTMERLIPTCSYQRESRTDDRRSL